MEAAVSESLTAALAANTAALAENNRLLVEAAGGREKVLAAAERASAPKPAATRTKPAATEPAAEPAPAAAEPDLNDPLNKAITEFVGGTTRPEERAARVARVQELFTKVGATGGASTVPADKRQAFINTLKKDLENGDLVPVEEAPAPVEDDLLLT